MRQVISTDLSDEQDEILLEAEFKGIKGNFEDITSEKSEVSAKRKSSQPLNFRSAGSIFKNPSESISPISPVYNHPSLSTFSVSSFLFQ